VLEIERGFPEKIGTWRGGKFGGDETFLGGVALKRRAVAALLFVETRGECEVDAGLESVKPGDLGALIVEIGGAINGAGIADEADAMSGKRGGVDSNVVPVVVGRERGVDLGAEGVEIT